jgi:hypothetical protein
MLSRIYWTLRIQLRGWFVKIIKKISTNTSLKAFLGCSFHKCQQIINQTEALNYKAWKITPHQINHGDDKEHNLPLLWLPYDTILIIIHHLPCPASANTKENEKWKYEGKWETFLWIIFCTSRIWTTASDVLVPRIRPSEQKVVV